MFTCDFSKRGELPLWEYLCAGLKRAVSDGTFPPGEKLPSKRALAGHLGVSVITVAAAYSQLISEGWIYSIERKGFFAAPVAEMRPDFSRRVRSTAASRTRSGKAGTTGGNRQAFFADFTGSSAAPEKFPFSRWSAIIRSILRDPPEKLLTRCGPQGLPELREEISSYLFKFRSIQAPPERIVVCPGTEYAYGMLVQLLGRERIYAVENPGYRKTAEALRIHGAQCRPAGMDGEGIRIDEAEACGASVIHVSPSHHYPTGKVTPLKRRLELLAWSAEGNRWILEDDYDSEFRFSGRPLESLQSLSENAGNRRVIYTNTFTRTLAPSLRISYIVLPETLAEEFRQKLGFLSCAVPNLDQMALARFMHDGNLETHILRMKNHYRTVRNNLIAAITNGRLGGAAKIREENAGLHFLLTLDTGLRGAALKQTLAESGIRVNLLADYFFPGVPDQTGYAGSGAPPEEAERTLVVNYSALGRERITPAVRRMEQALAAYTRRGRQKAD